MFWYVLKNWHVFGMYIQEKTRRSNEHIFGKLLVHKWYVYEIYMKWRREVETCEVETLSGDAECGRHQCLGSPAPDSSWPDRNNPSQYACKAAGMFRAWRV